MNAAWWMLLHQLGCDRVPGLEIAEGSAFGDVTGDLRLQSIDAAEFSLIAYPFEDIDMKGLAVQVADVVDQVGFDLSG